MAQTFASWVPGYSVVAEGMGTPPLGSGGHPFAEVNGFRQGFGVTFRLQAGSENWFHCPLPTPVLVEGRRAGISRVMILFRFPPGAELNQVNVYDGQSLISVRDGLHITGDHSGGLDPSNIFDVNRDALSFGVGVTMLVRTINDADLFFSGVGGDFFHDI
ncbi:DUF6623 family protein [Streptomyces sp. NPDC046261]|uniref:DUF6623 family protein n=1 Tax=Streptomyces sp. NPDC046261 TaxID=3157200 RepID=UPI0033EB9402